MEKQVALDSINGMPTNFELEDLFERLILLDKIEKGRQDIKNGNVVSHEEASKKLSKWLK